MDIYSEINPKTQTPPFDQNNDNAEHEVAILKRGYNTGKNLMRTLAGLILFSCSVVILYGFVNFGFSALKDLFTSLPLLFFIIVAVLIIFVYRKGGLMESNLNKTLEHVRG